MALTAENEKQLIASLRTGLFIDGTWRDASNGETFEVEDPATGAALTTVANATPEDGMAALAAAAEAQDSWGRTAPRERAELLRRAFETVTERADDFEAGPAGWTYDAATSTATAGNWTWGDPDPTAYQPGDDVTPGERGPTTWTAA